MTIAIVGVVLNILGLFCLAAAQNLPPSALGCVGLFDLISVVGLVVASSGSKRLGAYMIGAGGIIHIPLGAVALIGAKQVHDDAATAGMDQFDELDSESHADEPLSYESSFDGDVDEEPETESETSDEEEYVEEW